MAAVTPEDRMHAHELRTRWGVPESFPLRHALELLHLEDASEGVAFRYASLEAAQAFAASNAERHGYRSVQAETPEGVIGVVFL